MYSLGTTMPNNNICNICELMCRNRNSCCITGIFHDVDIEDSSTSSVGVYIFGLDNSWRYIGSSTYIRSRLLVHHKKVEELKQLCEGIHIKNISIYKTDNGRNARNLERKMIYKLKPKLNEYSIHWNTYKLCRPLIEYYNPDKNWQIVLEEIQKLGL